MAKAVKEKARVAPVYLGTGRRKTSVARVRLTPGEGRVLINGRSLEDYFPRNTLRTMLLKPFLVTKTQGRFDVHATLDGGGIGGQAGAVRLGISRALLEADPGYREDLKRAGFLTRDPREVERKKYGLKKARKRPQFSKR